MDSNGREVAGLKDLVQLGGAKSALDEDDGLVKLKLIEQLVQFAVLLLLLKLDVVLLKTVQGELLLGIDINLERILHKLLADGSDLLGEGSAEHHDLLLGGGSPEDFLNVTTHVY